MRRFTAQLARNVRCTLGEGPVWWEDALWFVDIEARQLHRYVPSDGTHTVFDAGGRIGFAVPSERHGWVVGLDASMAAWRPGENNPLAIVQVEPPERGTRMNDGKCDPSGRLYAGTMHLAAEPNAGSLYRFDEELRPHPVVPGVTISNGLAWDAARGVMYYIDTGTSRVDAFDWCAETGEIGRRRHVATLQSGSPDGMCIAADGTLWVAMWGGARVACVDPRLGEEVGRVELPCPNVTSCCFGGEGYGRLWITTARLGMGADDLGRSPHAGGVFVADVGVSAGPAVAIR